jgi:Icc-related predicted phosphoesterase
MLLSVFGDVHGNLRAVDDLASRWEASRGKPLHAILLAGDVGMYPDPRRFDGPTLHHDTRRNIDPTLVYQPARYVAGELEMSHQVYFCRGNHEDHQFLRKHRDSAVDPGGKLVYWAGGNVHELREGGKTVRVLTLGGIHPASWRDPFTDPKGRRTPPEKYFDAEELRAADSAPAGTVDILLTHDGPVGMCLTPKPEAGSPFLLSLVMRLQPRFHFFGHYGIPPPPTRIGKSWVVPLNQRKVVHVPFRDGGMGVLDTEAWTFEFVFDVDHVSEPREDWGILSG